MEPTESGSGPETAEIELDQETISKVANVERSISFWSIELGKLSIRVDDLKQTIRTLHQSREGLILQKMKDAGIDTDRVARVDIDTKGKAQVILRPASSEQSEQSEQSEEQTNKA